MNKQKKIAVIAAMAAVMLLGIFLWQTKKDTAPALSTTNDDKKISVIATFYPLEEFARAVGGDAV